MHQSFREKQRFTQWWMWGLLIGITLIPLYGLAKPLFGQDARLSNLSNVGLIVFLLSMLLLLAFMASIQLTTEIDEQTISIKFFPFFNKSLPWGDVQSAQVIDYGFVGGWGIRMGTKYGTIYNIRGQKGLAIELKNGKKLCIGTQREAELTAVIEKLGLLS